MNLNIVCNILLFVKNFRDQNSEFDLCYSIFPGALEHDYVGDRKGTMFTINFKIIKTMCQKWVLLIIEQWVVYK